MSTEKSEIQREIEAHAERDGWTPEAKALLDAAALHQRIGDLERELSRVTESIRNLCTACGFPGDGTLMGVYEAVEGMKLAIAGLTEERNAAKAIAYDMENKVIGGAYAAVLLRRYCGLDDTKEDLEEVAGLVATLRAEIERWKNNAGTAVTAEIERLQAQRDAALRRVGELESLALGSEYTSGGSTWVEVIIPNDRLNPDKLVGNLGLAFPARLDAAKKGG